MADEQRATAIAVARDIQKQLAATVPLRMAVGNGYIVLPKALARDIAGDLRDNIDAVAPACTVCMLGAALLSKARLYDAVPVLGLFYGPAWAGAPNVSASRDSIAAGLSDVFDAETLEALESAFEASPHMGDRPTDLTRGAAVFGRLYGDPTDRAAAIAQNLIDNGGRFVVEPVKEEDFVYDDDEDDFDDRDEDLDDFEDD